MKILTTFCLTFATSLVTLPGFGAVALAETANGQAALQNEENVCVQAQGTAMGGAVTYYLDGAYRFPKTAKEKDVFRRFVWKLAGGKQSCPTKRVFDACWSTNYPAIAPNANTTYWRQQYITTYGQPPPYQRELLAVPS